MWDLTELQRREVKNSQIFCMLKLVSGMSLEVFHTPCGLFNCSTFFILIFFSVYVCVCITELHMEVKEQLLRVSLSLYHMVPRTELK